MSLLRLSMWHLVKLLLIIWVGRWILLSAFQTKKKKSVLCPTVTPFTYGTTFAKAIAVQYFGKCDVHLVTISGFNVWLIHKLRGWFIMVNMKPAIYDTNWWPLHSNTDAWSTYLFNSGKYNGHFTFTVMSHCFSFVSNK